MPERGTRITRHLFAAILALTASSLTAPPAHAGTTVLAAGDQHACEGDGDAATAGLLDRAMTIVAVGDMGAGECYAATWGVAADRTIAVAGNHEWTDGTMHEFASQLGPNPNHATYYTTTRGRWRLYVLDTNCGHVDCDAEVRWLRRRLAESPTRCVAAFMHHPPRSSTRGDGYAEAMRFRNLLHRRGGADLIISAHRHVYERFDRMGSTGPDPSGPRAFVVGTGGSSRWPVWRATPVVGSQVRIGQTWGALRLNLRWDGYSWAFIDVEGTELDAGTDRCTRG